MLDSLFSTALMILAEGETSQVSPWMQYVPIVGIALLFYFILIAPERRKQKEQDRMQSELKKNDRVVTLGGIMGVVANTSGNSKEVVIRIDEGNNTKIRVLRSHIAKVVNDKDKSDDESETKTAKS